jgi:hypothetical protein
MKNTWKILNSILSRHSNKKEFPNHFTVNGKKVINKDEIANKFNDFFVNIGPELASKITSQAPNPHNLPHVNLVNSFYLSPTTTEEIISIIKILKPKTSCGYDGISPKFIKSCSLHTIAAPLAHIANTSFRNGKFPTDMKKTKVIPIHKSNDPSQMNNYRPISLLPAFSKIIERLVHNRLTKYLTLHSLLSPSQYGFQKNLSTELAILEIQDRIVHALNNKQWCIGIFLDLSKAFDTLDHSLLLSKLSHYGIRGTSLTWFKSYLQDRWQYVSYENCSSIYKLMVCGVPQGSILGPLLFIVYLNDLDKVNGNYQMLCFADDTNMLHVGADLNLLIPEINSSLKKINDWFSFNKLSLNISKTNFMIFHSSRKKIPGTIPIIEIDNQPLNRVESCKFLGVYIDQNLSWKVHLRVKTKKDCEGEWHTV